MSANDAERLVNLADEWLAEHRVSESWRMISALRDGLVRQVDASRPFTEEDVEAALNAYLKPAPDANGRESLHVAMRAALDAVAARRNLKSGGSQ